MRLMVPPYWGLSDVAGVVDTGFVVWESVVVGFVFVVVEVSAV